MTGLMLAGVLLALRGRWITGSVLIGLAVMVKSPAALALLFVGVVVGRAASGPTVRRVAKGLLAPGLVAGAVAVGATLVCGTGFGWLGTQGVAGRIHTALSVSSDLGLGLGELLRMSAGTDPDVVRSAVQNLGLLVALVLIGRLAWHAATGRTEPVRALGTALLVLVALSPMVQPWYLLWATAVLAATVSGGRARGRGDRAVGRARLRDAAQGLDPAVRLRAGRASCAWRAWCCTCAGSGPRRNGRPGAGPAPAGGSSPADAEADAGRRTMTGRRSGLGE